MQKKLRIKIHNSKQTNKTQRLKKEINYVLHRIHKRTKELKDKHLQQLVEDIDKSSSDGGMFKAIKTINKKRLDNPKINDNEGKQVTNPKLIKQIITEHFQSKFRDEDHEDIEPFNGEPRPL